MGRKGHKRGAGVLLVSLNRVRMGEPTFNGLVVATNRNTDAVQAPHGDKVIELHGEAILRHESGAYIRFSSEGDIFIVPAANRTAVLGHGSTSP